jgi:hypothetical protein
MIIVRDDLIGGTKMVCMPSIEEEGVEEYVYASPVYGGFQISLSKYFGKKMTIFCAKRNFLHPNTVKCKSFGATIVEVPYGYMSVVEKKAREYANKPQCKKIVFGGKEYKGPIINHITKVMSKYTNIDEIWCAVGSGTLASSIQVYGVCVGGNVNLSYPNLHLIKYPKPFEYESKQVAPFPSMPNYDLKAYEICLQQSKGKVVFWNVL